MCDGQKRELPTATCHNAPREARYDSCDSNDKTMRSIPPRSGAATQGRRKDWAHICTQQLRTRPLIAAAPAACRGSLTKIRHQNVTRHCTRTGKGTCSGPLVRFLLDVLLHFALSRPRVKQAARYLVCTLPAWTWRLLNLRQKTGRVPQICLLLVG